MYVVRFVNYSWSVNGCELILHQLHHQSGSNLDAFQISLALISGTKAEHNIHIVRIDQGSQLLLQRIRLFLKLRCFHRIIFSECEINEFKYAVCLALIIGRIVCPSDRSRCSLQSQMYQIFMFPTHVSHASSIPGFPYPSCSPYGPYVP